MLRGLGYLVGYSVIITNSDNLKLIYEVVGRIKDTYCKLKERDKCNVLLSPSRIKIGVIRFRPATREDMQTLISMFKEYLKESLLTIKQYIVRNLMDESKDLREINVKVQEMLRKLREQDKYKLLESDKELRKLLLLIDVLTI